MTSQTDGIVVLPHVTDVPDQPHAGTREKYMSLSIEHQMAAQSVYLADVLEYSGTRLNRDSHKVLRHIQLDLVRWAVACSELRSDLEDMKRCHEEMMSPWWKQMFKEWWDRPQPKGSE